MKIYIPLLIYFYCSFLSAQEYNEEVEKLTQSSYNHLYTHQDSTYYYFDKIYELAVGQKDFILAIEMLINTSRIASYHYNLPKIKESIEKTDSLIHLKKSILDTLNDSGNFYKNSNSFEKGDYYFKLKDYEKSKIHFNTLISSLEKLPEADLSNENIDLLSSSYSYVATIFNEEDKYDMAKLFYEKNIRLYLTNKPEDTNGLNKIYNLYAKVFADTGDFRTANKYLLKTLKQNIENYSQTNKNSIVTSSLLISQNYKNIGQIDSAEYYLNSIKPYLLEDDPFLRRFHSVYAELLHYKGEYKKALGEYEEALRMADRAVIPVIYNEVGKLHFSFGETEKAVSSYQKGLQNIVDDFTSDNFKDNPEVHKVNQKNLLLELLRNKATALNSFNTEEEYKIALLAIDAAVETLDTLKPNFINEIDKLLLIENAYPVFETGLSSLFNLYSLTKSEEYLEKIFRFMEKSKSTVLLEALLGLKATSFANIPTHLTEKEKELRSNINYFNKSLESSPENSRLKEDLFKTIQERAELIKHIESTYPQYYNLKYNSEVIELSEAQKLCKNEEAIVSYFFGEKTIYAVILDASYKECIRIAVTDSLLNNVNNLKTILADPGSDIKDISELSYKLYSKILEPLIGNKKYKKLTIIPDGPFNYIPFEVLNTNHENQSYLLKNVAVSYTNSLTLLSQLNENIKYNNDVLAFAPVFNNEGTLSQLPNNVKETSGIFTHFTGKEFINEEATLDNFKIENNKFGIIHLATHAILNDKNPELSYLAFTENKKNNYLLYTSDLYNLNLNASLITLSACETDLGDLNKGEGLISLSRGFFYAGAKSIVSTKWKINDASTSHIMDRFYYHLSKGENKDRALQQAKLDFLKTNKHNPLSHPYYWSAFVLSGNTDAVMPSTIYWYWLIPGLVLLLLLIVLMFKKRKKLV